MTSRKLMWSMWTVALVAAACNDPTLAPDAQLAPSFHRDSDRHRTVVVDPDGRHDATTIQAGIDLVTSGGRVQVKAGTYTEALVIDKGLTLEGIGGSSGPVIIAPPGAPTIGIQIATPDHVRIRDLEVHFSGANGIRGDGVVHVTVEHVTVQAINPPLGQGRAIAFFNDSGTSGGRAYVMLRDNAVDGGVSFKDSPTPAFPQMFGIVLNGDVTGRVQGNIVRHTGGASIFVQPRLRDLDGETNVDIVANDLDEFYPLLRAGGLLVGAPSGPTGPLKARGVVNIIGNTIRNTLGSPLPAVGITQGFAPGRIEGNRILGVVQPGAVASGSGNPGAIRIGTLTTGVIISPSITPVIRFNDIAGNAQAGLRISPNITDRIDATCNWWGSGSGPSGSGSGTGDAVVVDAGAATPTFTPFATRPIAEWHRDGDRSRHDHNHAGSCRAGERQ